MSKRDMYVEQLKAQLDIWNANISKLEAQGRQVEASAKEAYEQQIRQIHQQRDEALARYHEIQATGGEAWEDVRAGAESAWAALSASIERAMSRFK